MNKKFNMNFTKKWFSVDERPKSETLFCQDNCECRFCSEKGTKKDNEKESNQISEVANVEISVLKGSNDSTSETVLVSKLFPRDKILLEENIIEENNQENCCDSDNSESDKDNDENKTCSPVITSKNNTNTGNTFSNDKGNNIKSNNLIDDNRDEDRIDCPKISKDETKIEKPSKLSEKLSNDKITQTDFPSYTLPQILCDKCGHKMVFNSDNFMIFFEESNEPSLSSSDTENKLENFNSEKDGKSDEHNESLDDGDEVFDLQISENDTKPLNNKLRSLTVDVHIEEDEEKCQETFISNSNSSRIINQTKNMNESYKSELNDKKLSNSISNIVHRERILSDSENTKEKSKIEKFTISRCHSEIKEKSQSVSNLSEGSKFPKFIFLKHKK